jgi:hypothetical protein
MIENYLYVVQLEMIWIIVGFGEIMNLYKLNKVIFVKHSNISDYIYISGSVNYFVFL